MSAGPGQILVVDDNEMNRDMLSRRLGRRGFDVATAADGQEALEALDQQPFDLVLLDIMMPGIDGMEVLRRVRETRSASELPIIMATAKTESEDVVEALKLGANDYVTKPLDFPVVLARVSTQLSLKQANEELARANERMKRSLEAAARVQQTLLPDEVPSDDSARFAWLYRPCDELAGDSLDIFRINDHQVVLYLLDVSGHGVPASLLSVTVTRRLSPHAGRSSPGTEPHSDLSVVNPVAVATRLNSAFPMAANGGHYFTLLYGVLDTDTGEFRFVSAGHPGPIVVRSGEPESIEVSGFPIGMFEEAEYEETVVELHPGERLYLYSDGLEEEMNPTKEQFGLERLQGAIKNNQALTLEESIHALVEKVVRWRGDEHLKDDASIAAVELM